MPILAYRGLPAYTKRLLAIRRTGTGLAVRLI